LKFIKFLILVPCLLFCIHAYAIGYPSYYCANTFKSIRVGDSTDAVQAACGTPSATTMRQQQISMPATTVQWVYSLGFLTSKNTIVSLPTLMVNFDANQRVVTITRGGAPINISVPCTINHTINIGDSMNTVMAACGPPNFTNSQQTTVNVTKYLLEWTYNFGPYKPQIILDFDNGQLTQIVSGQLGH